MTVPQLLVPTTSAGPGRAFAGGLEGVPRAPGRANCTSRRGRWNGLLAATVPAPGLGCGPAGPTGRRQRAPAGDVSRGTAGLPGRLRRRWPDILAIVLGMALGGAYAALAILVLAI